MVNNLHRKQQKSADSSHYPCKRSWRTRIEDDENARVENDTSTEFTTFYTKKTAKFPAQESKADALFAVCKSPAERATMQM